MGLALSAVVLTVIAAVYARLRWPGAVAVGSDNDEYLDVAARLAQLEAPLSAGIEGTKYPLGYPALLAVVERVGLPPGPTSQVLNLVALVAIVALVVALGAARRPSRAAAGHPDPASHPVAAPPSVTVGLVAAAVVAVSPALWRDVYSTMPEILTVLLVVTASWLVTGIPTRRRVAALAVVGVAAVLLKSLALLVVGGLAVGATAWTWWTRRSTAAPRAAPRGADRELPASTREDVDVAAADRGADGELPAWAREDVDTAEPGPVAWLVPAVAATVVVGAGTLLGRRYPAHTTGYAEMFLLRDPGDASRGRLAGVDELVARTVADVPETVADLGRATLWPTLDTGLAIVAAVVLLGLGVVAAFRRWPGTPAGPAVAAAVVAYAAGLSAWPYHAPRFGLPLLPVAALGVGWVVASVTRRLAPAARGAVAVGVVAVLVGLTLPTVRDEGGRQTANLADLHASLDAFTAWAATDLPDDAEVVSFDYRELVRRIQRPVAPLAYDADPDRLLLQVGDADLLVELRGLHGRRDVQVDALLEAHGDRFELLEQFDRVRVFAHTP